VVLGTAAVNDPEVAEAIASAHPERVVAAVDARAGKVAAEGWTEKSKISPAELAGALSERGIERFIYTPVEVDGTMEGPDLDSLREVASGTEADLIYSGGVGSLQDLEALGSLDLDNLEGVIVGKALYESRFTVAEAQEALGE
jgi:phosphoribosylformimino-5-aminoimidazole carboxamide ribotide isomerase